MNNLIREPLVHFLAIGLGLFVLFEFVAPENSDLDSKTIIVDRNALLTFVQYRSKAFNPQVAAARLDALSEAELKMLIDDFVREEALHREAQALGMDVNDYVIKQRMIQSLQFITNGFVTSAVDVSNDDVANYYEANKDDYYVDPFVTFTHVFFSGDRHGAEQAHALAEAKVKELNEAGVPFSESTRHGERFLYNVNYVERTEDFVGSHFGRHMAQALFALDPNDQLWQGPLESAYGYHLVMVSKLTEGMYPDLADVEQSVRDDALRVEINEKNELAVQAIVGTYDVRMNFERGTAE
ncbi:MAG: peptidyl-prolyl cis-trans isomerase [Woeseiaceae bacterium]